MQNWLVVIVAVLGGGGGIAGVITAVVAWRGSGRQDDDSRYSQLSELVTQYKNIVDEYRQEGAKDAARIELLEKRDEQCQKDLTEIKNSNVGLERKVHALEAKVAELGG